MTSNKPPGYSSAKLKAELIANIPKLRAFAVSLCQNGDRADDLVQETLVKAWGHLGSFAEGSNLAWLFTILRNTYFSQYRKQGREISDADGIFAEKIAVAPGQNDHMHLLDLRVALAQLPADQREALVVLIGGAGHSYEEAANICGCAAGTIKSRQWTSFRYARLREHARISPPTRQTGLLQSIVRARRQGAHCSSLQIRRAFCRLVFSDSGV